MALQNADDVMGLLEVGEGYIGGGIAALHLSVVPCSARVVMMPMDQTNTRLRGLFMRLSDKPASHWACFCTERMSLVPAPLERTETALDRSGVDGERQLT